jgi:hypothetical protein
VAKLSKQPGAAKGKVSFDRPTAHAKSSSGILDAEVGDEPQPDGFRHARVLHGKLVECRVEASQEFIRGAVWLDCRRFNRIDVLMDKAATAFSGPSPPGVIDQMPLHLNRHQLEEGASGREIDWLVPAHPEKGLMNQCSRLQRVVGSLASHHSTGNAPELGIHGVHDLIGGLRIAAAPSLEQLTDVARFGFHDGFFRTIGAVPSASCLRRRGTLRDFATPLRRWS